MEDLNKLDTKKLLMILDDELELKCQELKEKNEQLRLQKIFFLSCITILAAFFLQAFFKLFNLNIVLIIIIYQIIALMVFIPIIPKVIKGDVTQ